MVDFTDWPEPVIRRLQGDYGQLVSVQRLGGMSQGRVYRVRLGGGSVIVKQSPGSREEFFYRVAAPHMEQAGVAVPSLHSSFTDAGYHWLVLEDIPRPLPPERWEADEEALGVLARLHGAVFDLLPGPVELYVPKWDEEMTLAAVSCFPRPTSGEMRGIFEQYRAASSGLFQPLCWISGDPNPTNWGVREDGATVLYDWERFARGTPALDLAIAVPGLGSPHVYSWVAERYLAQRSDPYGAGIPIQRLAADIRTAKLWSVVEFLSLYARGAVTVPKAHIGQITSLVQAWVGESLGDAS